MRSVLILSIFITFSLISLEFSHADCVQTGNTPSGGNIIDCPAPIQNGPLNIGTVPATTAFDDEINIPEGGGINATGDNAIFTTTGDDIVRVSGTVTNDTSPAIHTSNDDDTVIVDGGTIMSTGSHAIFTSSDNDTVIVNSGMLDGISMAIFTSSANDYVEVNGGTLKATNSYIISMGSGDDEMVLNGGTFIRGILDPIFLGPDNDSLTLGADIELNGPIDCGEDFDTIVFAMDVPIERLNFFSNQIALATVPDGSVTINGIFYEWIECELLVNELVGVRITRPIPTLSEWGLIAMASLIGVAGIMFVMRKRKVTV